MPDRELASYGSRVAARVVDILATWVLAALVASPWIIAAVATGAVRDTIGKNVLGTATGGLYSVVDYLWPVFDSENRALHDLMAKTDVVRASRATVSACAR